MKIGFDISQTCENKSGTGFFADQLINALAEINSDNDFTLFPHFYDYCPRNTLAATKINNVRFEQKIIDDFSDNNRIIKGLDIIHSNNFRYPKDTKAKKVVTIYDVCFLEYPEFTTEANRLFCYQGTLDAMLFADKIIAISKYTKERLIHFFPFVNKDKIDVIYCGNRDTLLSYPDDIKYMEKFGINSEQYFLSVGTIEPRKNYETLLKAYKEYLLNSDEHKKLCIAGGYGWLEDDFHKKIEALGLEDNVVVTGYVKEIELANLYRHCYAFIYPTWYEGFGLPVLEAMNFNKPVIASDVSSIPEIIGSSDTLIAPSDFVALCGKMLKLETNKTYYQTILEQLTERKHEFSWVKSAEKLLNVYLSLMN